MLQNHNLKVTPQRLEIVDILHKNGHINIDNLYKELRAKFPSLSLATIYKNINTMISKLFLSEVKIPHQKNVYEITKEVHSHIVCLKCNDIMDLFLDTSHIKTQAQAKSNYSIEASLIVFNGICSKCKNTHNH